MAPSNSLHLDVILNVPHPAALTAFIADLSNRQSLLFHHFLRPGQFGPRFGPTLAEIAAVRSALQKEGLSPGRVASDRLAIPVTASAAKAERAFGTTLARYRLPGGRVAYANANAPQIPAAVAPYVSGVLGLDDLYLAHDMLVRPSARSARQHQAPASPAAAQPRASGPAPCAAASAVSTDYGSFTADELASHYGMSPLYSLASLSPNHGAARGGNKVTIHGRNFVGVQSVHFGGKLATHVKVVSSTEITVTAPSGSGTVSVTVTAGGRTSAGSRYKY